MISREDPIIFLIITMTISLAWAAILFFSYLRKKGKTIPHIFAASVIILLMGIIGAVLGLITNSGTLLTTVYATGLGFMGAIFYAVMQLIEIIKK